MTVKEYVGESGGLKSLVGPHKEALRTVGTLVERKKTDFQFFNSGGCRYLKSVNSRCHTLQIRISFGLPDDL